MSKVKNKVPKITKKKLSDEDYIYYVTSQDEREALQELVPRESEFKFNEWSSNDYQSRYSS